MMTILATVRAVEGKGDAVKAGLQALVAPSRAEGPCGRYELFATEDPNVLLVLEEWEGQAALDAHMETEHFKAFVAANGDALAAPPVVQILTPVA